MLNIIQHLTTPKEHQKGLMFQKPLMSNDAILSILKSESSIPIISEEGSKIDYSTRKNWKKLWIVDPLDGTANYNRDIPICCVSIGMIKDMKPLFGVIYDFNNDEIYFGDCINKVATLNNSPIQVSKVDHKKDGVLITGLPFNTDYSDSSLNNLINDMQSWKKTRMIGSAAMASCYIASGRAEVYKEKGIYIWDILAGAAIVEIPIPTPPINLKKANVIGSDEIEEPIADIE